MRIFNDRAFGCQKKIMVAIIVKVARELCTGK